MTAGPKDRDVLLRLRARAPACFAPTIEAVCIYDPKRGGHYLHYERWQLLDNAGSYLLFDTYTHDFVAVRRGMDLLEAEGKGFFKDRRYRLIRASRA